MTHLGLKCHTRNFLDFRSQHSLKRRSTFSVHCTEEAVSSRGGEVSISHPACGSAPHICGMMWRHVVRFLLLCCLIRNDLWHGLWPCNGGLSPPKSFSPGNKPSSELCGDWYNRHYVLSELSAVHFDCHVWFATFICKKKQKNTPHITLKLTNEHSYS